MKTVAIVNLGIFLIVYGIAMYLGLNPKKWQTWLLGLYGFLTLFLVGIVGTGNFYESIKAGALGIAVIFGGIVTYWNRERARKWLQEHEEKELESIQKLDMRTSSKNKKRDKK